MLHNINELYGKRLIASDGDIGEVKDFYFDDKTWVIRYLVANTGLWLTGRHVLISPHALGKWDWGEKTLQVKLHKKQIEDSPSLESHKPVSRPYEMEYYRYYGWPAYWSNGAGNETAIDSRHPRAGQHLQSTQGLTGYHIQATDATIGRVIGLLVDERSWAIRELVVETGHWHSGKEVLIQPSLIERTSYADSKIFLNLTEAEIQRTTEDNRAKAGSASSS